MARRPLTDATTGFSGSMARGSSMNFQVSPSLIMSGIWRKAIRGGAAAASAWPPAMPGKIIAFSYTTTSFSRPPAGSAGITCG